MKITNSQTWYDYCEYWTDNGIYLELNHGYSQNVSIKVSLLKDGIKLITLQLGSERSEKSVWKTTMLGALAKRLVANEGRDIIRRIFQVGR